MLKIKCSHLVGAPCFKAVQIVLDIVGTSVLVPVSAPEGYVVGEHTDVTVAIQADVVGVDDEQHGREDGALGTPCLKVLSLL